MLEGGEGCEEGGCDMGRVIFRMNVLLWLLAERASA